MSTRIYGPLARPGLRSAAARRLHDTLKPSVEPSVARSTPKTICQTPGCSCPVADPGRRRVSTNTTPWPWPRTQCVTPPLPSPTTTPTRCANRRAPPPGRGIPRASNLGYRHSRAPVRTSVAMTRWVLDKRACATVHRAIAAQHIRWDRSTGSYLRANASTCASIVPPAQ